MAITEDFGNLCGRFRQHHEHRQLAVCGQPIGFIGAPFILVVDDPFARDDLAHRLGNFGAPVENAPVRFRHLEQCGLP